MFTVTVMATIVWDTGIKEKGLKVWRALRWEHCLPHEGVLPVALQLRSVQLGQRPQRVAGALHQ